MLRATARHAVSDKPHHSRIIRLMMGADAQWRAICHSCQRRRLAPLRGLKEAIERVQVFF